MRRGIGVGVVLLLALGLLPATVSGQEKEPGRRPRAQLGQNYPNPFNPTTYIPIDLRDEGLFENGKTVVLTIRIFNALQQFVAYPKPLDHPAGKDRVENLEYTAPGEYRAYWDGTDKNGRRVASGVYYMRVEVNGERLAPIKMVVAK